jgi:dihydrolipoamide dehydrogenase
MSKHSRTAVEAKNVVVVGAGPGGYACAIRLAQQGHQVTLIEKENLGGTCLNWGCIPSKAFIHVGEFYHQLLSGESEGFGVSVSQPTLDWQKTQAWKDGILTRLRGGIQHLLAKHKVKVIKATATLLSNKTISLTDAVDSHPQVLQPQAIVLAMGSSPTVLPEYTTLLDGHFILNSNQLMVLPQLPKTITILGGGIIGLELGCMLAHLGVAVSIVEFQASVLSQWHPETVSLFLRQLKTLGVRLYLETRVEGVPVVNEAENRVTLNLINQKTSQTTVLSTKKLLLCTGRKPNLDALGTSGVALTPTGKVSVNEQLETTVQAIYAIGDLIEGPQLAHKASKEGLLVADVISGFPEVKDWRALPSVVYTAPELAQVGWNEAQAKASGYPKAKTVLFGLGALGRAHTLSTAPSPKGHFILVVDADTDVVLGGEVVAPNAGELIAEIALAVECGLTATDVALTVHAHPTLSEGWLEVAEAVHKQAIHLFQAN